MCVRFSLRVYYVMFLGFSSQFLVYCLLSRGSCVFFVLSCGVCCVLFVCCSFCVVCCLLRVVFYEL